MARTDSLHGVLRSALCVPAGFAAPWVEWSAISTPGPCSTIRSGEVWPVAAGMWDRMLGFLGFEEEVDEDEEAVAATGRTAGVAAYADRTAMSVAHAEPAAAVGGRGDAGRRRSARPSRAAFGDERSVDGRSLIRSGNVTRLVNTVAGIVVSAPRRFEDSQESADHLKAGQPVILHLDGMDRELAQKVINFLAGSVYALGGEMHRVGSVVVFAPAGIEVTLPLSLRMAERDNR